MEHKDNKKRNDNKKIIKILHTGDTNSLDQCGQKHWYQLNTHLASPLPGGGQTHWHTETQTQIQIHTDKHGHTHTHQYHESAWPRPRPRGLGAGRSESFPITEIGWLSGSGNTVDSQSFFQAIQDCKFSLKHIADWNWFSCVVLKKITVEARFPGPE